MVPHAKMHWAWWVLGQPCVGIAHWGLLRETHSMLVSFSFTEDFSFMEDILVKLLWLG